MKKLMVLLILLTGLMTYSLVLAEEAEEEEFIFENQEYIVKAYRPAESQAYKESDHYVDAGNFTRYVITDKADNKTRTILLGHMLEWWETGASYQGEIILPDGSKIQAKSIQVSNSPNKFSEHPAISIGYSYDDGEKIVFDGITIRKFMDLERPFVEVYWSNRTYGVGKYEVDFDVQPQIVDGRTMIPVRAMMETLGYQVGWIPDKQEITCENPDFKISLYLNKNHIDVTELSTGQVKQVLTDVSPKIIDGRTLVPLRALAEISGLKVYWNHIDGVVHMEGRPISDLFSTRNPVMIDFDNLGEDKSPEMEPVDLPYPQIAEAIVVEKYEVKTGNQVEIFGKIVDEVLFGLKDMTGKVILDGTYKHMILGESPLILVYNKDYKAGLIDTRGNILFDTVFDKIVVSDDGSFFTRIEDRVDYYSPTGQDMTINLKGATFHYSKNSKYFLLKSNDNHAVYNLDGELVYKTSTFEIQSIDDEKGIMEVRDPANIFNGSNYFNIDFKGNLILDQD